MDTLGRYDPQAPKKVRKEQNPHWTATSRQIVAVQKNNGEQRQWNPELQLQDVGTHIASFVLVSGLVLSFS